MHASRVEELSRQVGGGWGGVPILLLGVLAAPNAAIAGSAYVIGPGFTVGAGTSVGALSTTHGLLPAFPLLGGVPAGHGATWYVWLVIVVTPLAAATAVARTAVQLDAWPARLRHVGIASAGSAMAWLVLAWQGGGGIGAGRLAVVGASPWQIGGVVLGELAALALVELSLYAAWRALRHRDEHRGTALGRLAREPAAGPVAAPSAVLSTKVVGAESNGTGSGNLDGSSSGNDSGKADGMGKLAG
jgi:hypothetical protein